MMRVPSEALASVLAAILAGLATLIAVACAADSLGLPMSTIVTGARVLAALVALAAGCAVALLWRVVGDDL